jgi:hypothetical protein
MQPFRVPTELFHVATVFAVESLVEPALVRSGMTETSPASHQKPAAAALSKTKALFADRLDQ